MAHCKFQLMAVMCLVFLQALSRSAATSPSDVDRAMAAAQKAMQDAEKISNEGMDAKVKADAEVKSAEKMKAEAEISGEMATKIQQTAEAELQKYQNLVRDVAKKRQEVDQLEALTKQRAENLTNVPKSSKVNQEKLPAALKALHAKEEEIEREKQAADLKMTRANDLEKQAEVLRQESDSNDVNSKKEFEDAQKTAQEAQEEKKKAESRLEKIKAERREAKEQLLEAKETLQDANRQKAASEAELKEAHEEELHAEKMIQAAKEIQVSAADVLSRQKEGLAATQASKSTSVQSKADKDTLQAELALAKARQRIADDEAQQLQHDQLAALEAQMSIARKAEETVQQQLKDETRKEHAVEEDKAEVQHRAKILWFLLVPASIALMLISLVAISTLVSNRKLAQKLDEKQSLLDNTQDLIAARLQNFQQLKRWKAPLNPTLSARSFASSLEDTSTATSLSQDVSKVSGTVTSPERPFSCPDKVHRPNLVTVLALSALKQPLLVTQDH